jgi:hypothetical protein
MIKGLCAISPFGVIVVHQNIPIGPAIHGIIWFATDQFIVIEDQVVFVHA